MRQFNWREIFSWLSCLASQQGQEVTPPTAGTRQGNGDRKWKHCLKKHAGVFCQVALPGRLRLWPPYLHGVPGCKEKISSLSLPCRKQKFLLGLEKLFTKEFSWFNLGRRTMVVDLTAVCSILRHDTPRFPLIRISRSRAF